MVLAAAAASKSLQSCPTLCDPIDGSPPGSPVPGILQARTLECSFLLQCKWSLMVDKHQNQLAKCPNDPQCSKMVLSIRRTSEPSENKAHIALCSQKRTLPGCPLVNLQSWCLSAQPDACFHPTKGEQKLAASDERGRNREDPQNKGFWQLLRTSPKSPSLG